MKLTATVVLFCLIPLPLLAEEPQWLSMTPAQRVQYVNTITDRIKGSNAAKTCLHLKESDYDLYRAQHEAQVDKPVREMALLTTWTPREHKAIRDWLQDNRKQLDLIKKIATKKRLYLPIDSKDTTWIALDRRWDEIPLSACAKLLAGVAAQEAAQRKDWRTAYEWNARQFNIVDLLLQQPGYPQVIAQAVEQAAHEQLLGFLYKNPPESPSRIWRKISKNDDTHLPQEILFEFDRMVAWDTIQAWHKWDKDPDKMPEWSKELNRILDSTQGMKKILGNKFETHTDFRRGLRKTTPEKDWKNYLKIAEKNEQWWSKPAWQAIPEGDAHSDAILEMQGEIPAFALLGRMVGYQRTLRVDQARTRAYRDGTHTVIALIDFALDEGEFPKTLEKLIPKYIKEIPIDPFSGKPFVYRASPLGKNFALYSVGANLRDDNGKTSESLLAETGDLVIWPPPKRQ